MIPIFRIFSGDISASQIIKRASCPLDHILDYTETSRVPIKSRADGPVFYSVKTRLYASSRGKNGRREWDRTTDHHHVKVVLYH